MPFQHQKPGTFLEIGVGANDFHAMPTPLAGFDGELTPFDFNDGNQYVGIDMPTDENRYWRGIHAFFIGGDLDIETNSRTDAVEISREFSIIRERIRPYRPDENISFIVADGQRLPFRDQSISETYMANVLGSQMSHEHIKRLLDEVGRVALAAGRLTVRENITPHWAPDHLDGMIRAAGFGKGVVKYMFGSAEYSELVRQYGLHPNDVDDDYLKEDRFFIVAER
jgi:hypothetical protein